MNETQPLEIRHSIRESGQTAPWQTGVRWHSIASSQAVNGQASKRISLSRPYTRYITRKGAALSGANKVHCPLFTYSGNVRSPLRTGNMPQACRQTASGLIGHPGTRPRYPAAATSFSTHSQNIVGMIRKMGRRQRFAGVATPQNTLKNVILRPAVHAYIN